jgi:ElaA protein
VTDLHVASFDELEPRVAYDLWALRQAVFVVEQDAAYLDLDGRDVEPATRHVWITEADRPVAYLRVLDDEATVRIGRVVVAPTHRRRGLAEQLMKAALDMVGERPSELHAQSYLEQWYTRFGYTRSGDDFLDDGILHTPMYRPPR